MYTSCTVRRGFTLIELSIVLIIIGLVVGAILTGQSLIESAMLQSVITDVQKFNTAVNTFHDKYAWLPGDCPNASTLLGLPVDTSDCPLDFRLNPGTTCNGNGDGMIRAGISTPSLQASHAETYLAWQDLSVVGLIPGTYTGFTGYGTSVAGVSSPASSVNGACYDIAYGWPEDSGEGWEYGSAPALTGNFVDFGLPVQYWNPCGGTFCSSRCHEPALTALQAYRVDSKVDDGEPMSGNVLSNSYPDWGTGMPACFALKGGKHIYNISGSAGPACPLAFRAQGF